MAGEGLDWSVTLAAQAAAGVVVLVLGLSVLARDHRSRPARLFFFLALVDGVTTLLVALSSVVVSTEASLRLQAVFWYYNPFLKSLLLLFALSFPADLPVFARHRAAVTAGLIALPVAEVALLVFARPLWIEPVTIDGVLMRGYRMGPMVAVDIVLQAAAIAAVLALLAWRLRDTVHPLQRTQVGYVLAGVIVGFVPPYFLNLLLRARILGAGPLELLRLDAAPQVVAFTYGCVALAVALLLVGRTVRGLARLERRAGAVSAEVRLAGSALLGITGVTAAAVIAMDFDVASLLFAGSNLAYVALLAYGVQKYRLFGLDVRLRGAAPPAIATGTFLAAFAGASALLAPVVKGTFFGLPAAFVVGGVLTAALAPPLYSVARGVSRRVLEEVNAPGYHERRRLEMYRALLEERQSRGGAVPADPDLARARETLSISGREHRILSRVVAREALDGPDPARPEPGRLLFGKYRIRGVLGAGSSGRAFLAHHELLSRWVVVKEVLLDGVEDGETAIREARVAARIVHPNLATVYDVEEAKHAVYLILEYVDGGSLEERLRSGPIPEGESVELVSQVLAGLEALHAGGIVHRDVKPANVLLTRDGGVKLTDFGLSVDRDEAGDTVVWTKERGGGTILYMSPEQAAGRAVDPRSDLYSLALVLHRMVAGRHAFPSEGRSQYEILRAHVEGRPAIDGAGVSPAIRACLARALALRPQDRFPNAASMRRALVNGTIASRVSPKGISIEERKSGRRGRLRA